MDLIKTPYYEESDCSLSELINMILSQKPVENDNTGKEIHIGKDIWDYISGLIFKENENKNVARIKEKDRSSFDSLLESIEQAISGLESVWSEDSQKMDCLGACQEAAIAVGERLDNILGEGSDIVSVLEDFCEKLYLAGSINDTDVSEVISDLSAVISDARQKLRSIPKLYTVCFLPYNYSMWDSLESIYEAAALDPLWESVVIPVPYFKRNHVGSLGESCYEGGKFARTVPIKAFSEVDLSVERPDVIFVHNPYDEYNYVTMIHPDFFCREIRKHTPMLVYSPYYIAVNDNDSEPSVCTSGVLHADKVLMQSEKLRECFISFYEKWMDDMGRPDLKNEASKKFVAFGSPKIDKLFSDVRSFEGLPLEWQMRIGTENEHKKIVLFYNGIGHVTGPYGDTFLKKAEWVFDHFRNRDDVLLWWRPHPLTRSTIQSLNPDILDRYDSLEREIDSSSWGILDYSDDMYPALQLSDAAYGFAGSVSEMYKFTGKPRLNMDIYNLP